MVRLTLSLLLGASLLRVSPAQEEPNLPPEPWLLPPPASEEIVETADHALAVVTSPGAFSVAYLRGNDEIPLRPGEFEALRSALAADEVFREAARLAGRSAPVVIGTDSHEDLARRMDAGEFDLVVAPALIFARHASRYSVLGQVRTPDVSGSSDRGGGLTQTSVIFVNAANPLFALENARAELMDDATLTRAATALTTRPLAVVSAASAVGYVFPLLKLRQVFGIAAEPPLLWCGTAEEAVIAVLNNLAPVGACDEATYLRVVSAHADGINPSTLIRVLQTTEPIPVAAVALRRDLIPGPLREALFSSINRFFERQGDVPRQLIPATDRPYQRLREQTDEFYRLRGER